MKLFSFLLISLFFVSCGYIPSTKAVDVIMDDEVWFDVSIDMIDPQNSVTLKDATIDGFVQRLGRKMAPSKELATSVVKSKIKGINFTALIYDRFGYVTTYKIDLTIEFQTKLKNGEIFTKTTSGDYDFEVSKQVKSVTNISSVISDKDRYEAIKNAANQALNEFISQLSLKGLMTLKQQETKEKEKKIKNKEFNESTLKQNNEVLTFSINSALDD